MTVYMLAMIILVISVIINEIFAHRNLLDLYLTYRMAQGQM